MGSCSWSALRRSARRRSPSRPVHWPLFPLELIGLFQFPFFVSPKHHRFQFAVHAAVSELVLLRVLDCFIFMKRLKMALTGFRPIYRFLSPLYLIPNIYHFFQNTVFFKMYRCEFQNPKIDCSRFPENRPGKTKANRKHGRERMVVVWTKSEGVSSRTYGCILTLLRLK